MPVDYSPKFRATANTWMASELSAGAAAMCSARSEIQHRSVINGKGRAPLIVVPDTGTRPQTKQDRAGAGCHAQSPSNRKPQRCSEGAGGDRGVVEGRRGHLAMTVEERISPSVGSLVPIACKVLLRGPDDVGYWVKVAERRAGD